MDTLICEVFTSFLLISSLIFHLLCAGMDTINGSQSIIDGETLVSSGGKFELGFFSPGNSRDRYIGLWPRNLTVQTVVWIANREVPITNTTGVVLTVVQPGILVLMNGGVTIWSSNTTRFVRNPVAQLLDSGNLVVRDANDDSPENFLWQSFGYPTDSTWAGMRIGWNLATGSETYLVSWRNNDDPSPGDVTFHLDPTGFPQVVVRRGDAIQYRIGPWNGIRFSGAPNSQEDPTFGLTFVMNENEVYYREDLTDRQLVARVTVNQSNGGSIAQRLTWVDGRGWVASINMPSDICDNYGLCGAYGICNVDNSPSCACLERFVPRDLDRWFRTDWTNGCVRRTNLSSCELGRGDVFLRYSGIKLPDARFTWHNTSMELEECRAECLRNCSCMAYTQLDISTRSGCLIWYDELIDIRRLSSYGQDIYIRMASSESESERRNKQILIGTFASVIGVALICLSLFLYVWKRKNDMKKKKKRGFRHKDSELQLFDLSIILKATNNFSVDNKLGEGGFGPVYKGMLKCGQEIAVKRLSEDSTQGLNEFNNEVILIAKLQHRNLVRILGCCVQGEENMLIYEYMLNKSLDVLLFDETKKKQLDWTKRFGIINGVARGLLYLHQDSRLRIIHRDLKASNILLDSDMNPKISDFGIARSFGGNETQAKTRRVIGTYGYMSPEYAVGGLFSMKSDVFSFGVLVLEIVTGNRNNGFFLSDNHSFNLLGHAWTMYKEGRSMELVDALLGGSYLDSEVLRSIHVGLLCVQKNPEDRPSMSSVVLMLGSEGELLPQAKQPGFFTEREVYDTISTEGNSINEITITMPEAR